MANRLTSSVGPQQTFTDSHDLIDYVGKTDQSPLPLLPEDIDAFTEALSVLSQYTGAIERKESLAASLGAKLKGPRLIRGLDNFFEGSINITPLKSRFAHIRWSDVVLFAKKNGDHFKHATPIDDSRRYEFYLKGCRVTISEDDWRLICSGAFDGLPLVQSFEDDEDSELATLEIVGERVAALHRRADEIAAQAKAFQSKIIQRTEQIAHRRQRQHPVAIEHGQPSDLRADLLRQFTANMTVRPRSRSTSESMHPYAKQTAFPQYPFMGAGTILPQDASWPGHNTSSSRPAQDTPDPIRLLVLRKADKTPKGEPLNPPCDRCRRLRYSCLKHMTACQACTKKHAKCSWKNATEEEHFQLRQELGISTQSNGSPITASADDAMVSRAGTESSHSPESQSQRVSIPSSAYLRDPSADFSFELAPLKMRTSLPDEPDIKQTLLPRLGESDHRHVNSVATQAIRNTENIRRLESISYPG